MTDTQRWEEAVERFFHEEGFTPLSEEEVAWSIPEKALEAAEINVTDPLSLSGFRPPTAKEVRRANNASAPYLDLMYRTALDIQKKIFAWIAEAIEARGPRLVVDAGCGTGSTLAFLAGQFPQIRFLGYDLAPKMLELTEKRLKRRGIKSVKLFETSHQKVWRVLPNAGVDFLFTKESLRSGEYRTPDFGDAPSAQLARQDFLDTDPIVANWRGILRAFTRVLKPNGIFSDIGGYSQNDLLVFEELCQEEGFERIDRDTPPLQPPMKMHCGHDHACLALSFRRRST